ncbi:HET-domain-containing protein [Ophiobolus disseminans]|uniref:HET-domain-containing protein n=1 Tax=Ophiobolus disseminans TaxID=1469910 RepID=A0A6A6ZFU7_9PLEO|nr:HET-domain-containing protein [Ophiobolus disseminans]
MPDEWSLSLFLGSEHTQPDGIVADIYLQFSVGDEGLSSMWVGDLIIADVGKSIVHPPRVSATVNWPHLRNAIDVCTLDHASCQPSISANLPHGFRLIDVAQRCIVETSEVEFIALSYVWGKDTRASLLTATRSSIAAFKKSGGLVAANMPQTIEDAMTICTELGVNYLWADRLCIIQDDPEDKMHQIMAMNDIYESASLVVVSAYGDSMGFGIDGISRPRTITQHHEEVVGLRITNLVRETAEDSLALWQTRGWTYQEAVCARRLLHFTDTRAYYECQTSTCYEDMYNTNTEINEFSAYGLRLQDEDSGFAAFQRHLANYTARKLSFSSDIYNAFIGIANLLYKSNYNESFFYGLPKKDFDRALCWYAWDGKKSIQQSETSTHTCPSWSWSSAMVQGEQVRYQDTVFYGTLTLWSTKVEDEETWEVLNVHPDTKVDKDWEIYMAIAAREGCIRSSPMADLSKNMDHLSLRESFHTRYPDYHTFCTKALSSSNPQPTSPSHNHLGPSYIHTTAQTAHLRLGPRQTTHYGVAILDSSHAPIGELCGEITHFRPEALASAHKDRLYEFIAISLLGLRIEAYTGEERTTKNYIDGKGVRLDMLPVVNVLMIQREVPTAND